MKIKVVAPLDVNMFTVGVKRFRHAEVLFQPSFQPGVPTTLISRATCTRR